MNVSKESIERGFKECKHTERDHDGSDFVYPKQKKKSIQVTIPHTEAQITGPDFTQQRKATLSRKTGI